MSTAQFLVGGLMKGVGQGMVDQGEERRALAERMRQEALARVQRQEDRDFQLQRDQSQQEFQIGRDTAASEERRGLLSRTITDESGSVHGLTAGGETFDTGLKDGERKNRSGSMSAEDYRLWGMAMERHTTNEETDWPAVAKRLREQGREDLAKLAMPSADEANRVDTGSPEWFKAEKMADEWVGEQAGVFRSDKSDFKAYGGNRAEARRAKTLEFYQQLTGRGTADGSEQSPAAGGAAVSGAGTREAPYQPTTQAQFDALPAGAIYKNPADGKLYRKS